MKRIFVSLVFTVLFFFSALCPSYGAEPIKLTFASFFAPANINSVVMEKFCQDVNKRSSGKVEISYYPGGTLLSGPKMAAGVVSGIADIGISNCMMVKGRFPVMEAIELPLGYPSGYIASHVACDLYDKVKPKEFDQYYPLMFSASPPSVVQTLKKRVNTLEDIKGLKIRAPGRLADTMKALGATPLPLEMADLYESLRRGVIDGNYGPVEQLKGWKIGELVRYAAATWKVGNTASFYVIMNKAKWDNLPPDVKKLFQEVSGEYKEKWAIAWTQQEIEGSEFLKSNGGQITPISDVEIARWIKATRPVLDIYKNDLVGKGYKAQEVETWFSLIQERIEYWKDKEKTNNVPRVYQY